MGGQEQWQFDREAAELYQRYLVPAVTAIWAADLVDRASVRPGERRGLRYRSSGTTCGKARERHGICGRAGHQSPGCSQSPGHCRP